MKVLFIHLSNYHKGGGGGIAMHRLRVALSKMDVSSKVLCDNITNDTQGAIQLPRKKLLESAVALLTSRIGLNDIHRIGSFFLNKMKVFEESDVINIHGTHHGTFSYLAFPKVSKSKPTFFTLHDMWATTGRCAYSYDCNRWMIGCGSCPDIKLSPAARRDASKIEFWLKKKVYEKSDMVFIAPSKWLYELARQSMLKDKAIYHVPYGLNLSEYKVLDKESCKTILGVEKGKVLLMTVAQSFRDPRKGERLLIETLKKMPDRFIDNIELLLLGTGGQSIKNELHIPVKNMGYIYNDRLKAMCYSASDIFVFFSKADNLPLVIQESMACGTPVISSNVGGISDLVEDGETGYLVNIDDEEDLREKIIKLVEDSALREDFGFRSRKKMEAEFNIVKQAETYMELFKKHS
jgi:glycosyltransferase involved in cell wall biosynthesis